MNSILRFITALLLLLVAAGGAWGQNHTPQDVLRVKALNVGTNGWGITNLAVLVTNIGMIYNPSNVTYTNISGSFVGSSSTYLDDVGATNASTTAGLFNDITLHPDRNGQPIITPILAPGPVALSNLTYMSGMTLFVEYVNPRGSNAAWGMTFRPVYNDAPPAGTTEDWGFNIAATTTGKGTLSTNIPVWKWPGAKALRAVAVTNLSILAGPDGQTNSTFVTKVQAVSFRP